MVVRQPFCDEGLFYNLRLKITAAYGISAENI